MQIEECSGVFYEEGKLFRDRNIQKEQNTVNCTGNEILQHKFSNHYF